MEKSRNVFPEVSLTLKLILGTISGGIGAFIGMLRACLINSTKMGLYSETKERLYTSFCMDGIFLQISAATISSFAGTMISCPADVVKSRMQSVSSNQYIGIIQCTSNIIKKEGIIALWKGFFPAIGKELPHGLISFIVFDNLTYFWLGKSVL